MVKNARKIMQKTYNNIRGSNNNVKPTKRWLKMGTQNPAGVNKKTVFAKASKGVIRGRWIKMEFYSVVLKKKIQISDSKVKTVVKKGRKFAVGKYEAKGKTYEAWRILGKA